MSNPTWPVITFRLNLAAAERQGWLLPSPIQPQGNETVSEASVIPAQFSSWIPGMLPGPNTAQKNDYEFTAYGQQATYLKNTYANGSTDDLLVVVE